MKRISRIIGATVAALFISSSFASAQQSKFYSYIDYPVAQGTIVNGSLSLVAAGWAFDSATGEHPAIAFPSVFNLDTQTFVPFQTFWMRDHIARPDVYNAFVRTFPRVSAYSGYQLYIANIEPGTGKLIPVKLPPGRYRIWVNWGKVIDYRDIQVIGG